MYINILRKSVLKPLFDRWMVRSAEHSVAAHAVRRLTEQSPR